MSLTIQDAIEDLYQVAVVRGASQSPARLKTLAQFCVQELELRGLAGLAGLAGVAVEQTVAGGGRAKAWDVAWSHDGKHRLALSLKSLLKNLSGTVPNRIDDLMGEAANVQLHSPEIIVGYIMVFDIGADAHSVKHNSTWADLLRSRLATLSGRRAPSWAIGTVEAAVMLEVDFAKSSALLSGGDRMAPFFDLLVELARERNPNAVKPPPPLPSQAVDNG